VLDTSAFLELEGPKFLLNLGASSFFMVPLFIASSISIPVAIKSFKIWKGLRKQIFMVYRYQVFYSHG